MITFKEYLEEAKLPSPEPTTQKSFEAVSKALGKGKTSAMMKHKWFAEYSSWDKAYKHGVSKSNFHEVEVYPYMSSVHKTPEGNVRPTTMLRFHFADSGKVAQVHKFMRDKEPSEEEKRNPGSGWKHVKSWKKEEE